MNAQEDVLDEAPFNSRLKTGTLLHELVRKLQDSLLPQATLKKSFIVNDIDRTVMLDKSEDLLAYILGNLLSNAVRRTSGSCIRIESAQAAGQLQIRIRNNGAFAFSSYINSLVHFVDIARGVGGNIGLETEENNGVTVVFSMAA
jgi:signal transduction histidine kinase